jgi:hypothetical protein
MSKEVLKRPTTEERFFSRINKNTGTDCWEWLGSFFATGYGQFWFNEKNMKAHRFSYELHKGPIPDGMCILHFCDNRKCCNPDHLSLGSRAENNKDRDNKNRQAKGSMVNTAKLTEEQIKEIRNKLKLGMKQKEIAKEYDINKSHIFRIKNGISWAHIKIN